MEKIKVTDLVVSFKNNAVMVDVFSALTAFNLDADRVIIDFFMFDDVAEELKNGSVKIINGALFMSVTRLNDILFNDECEITV